MSNVDVSSDLKLEGFCSHGNIAGGCEKCKSEQEAERASSKPKRIEAEIFETIKDKEFLTQAEFDDLIAKYDIRPYKMGTYRSGDGYVYLYAKKGFITGTKERAEEILAEVRDMTSRGMLLPETKWGIFQRTSGAFHVFAITRKLESVSAQDKNFVIPMDELRKRAGEEYRFHLDEGEAGTSFNWGYSKEHAQYYPIDIEVVAMDYYDDQGLKMETDYQNKLGGQGIIEL